MPNKQRYTNNVSNPLLKVINADSQLQENPTSTDRNLNVQLFGDDSGTTRKVAVNASGHILTDIEPDPETGLATAANQTNGDQISKIMGSEDGSTGGTQRQIHVDGSGNVQTNVVNTINTAPANNSNSHITDDPANTFAVGMKGRTTIGTATTETFLKCDTDGHLQVDVASGTVTATVSSAVIKANDGNDGSGTDRTVKCDGNGALIVDASKEGIVTSNGTTEALHCMMMGTNDNVNLRTVKVGDGGAVNTEVDHSWDSTNQLFNADACADGDTITSSTFDLGSGVSHEIGAVEFFLDNSGSVSLEVKGLTSYNGTDFYDNGASYSVNSSLGSFYFSQEDLGIGRGHRYMKITVTNNDGGGNSTNISLQAGYYK